MYTTYFGFREPPFLLPPNPRFLYTTPSTQEVYTSLLQGLHERKRCLLLTGEVGTGKTTLLHKLMDELAETAAIAFVYHTTLTFEEIITAACEEFGLPTPEGDIEEKVRILTDFAVTQFHSGKHVILLMDEAQDLQEDDLSQFTSLLLLTNQAESPLQILLAGQLELEEKLQSPGLQSLRQAIDSSYRLVCLPAREVGPFIRHRLRVAGCERQDLFSPQAIQRVVFHSEGIPRVINVLCDNALQIAHTHGQKTITHGTIDLAAKRILSHPDNQPADVLEPETASAEDHISPSILSTYPLSSALRPATWGAITLSILLVVIVGLWLSAPFSPETQPTLVHHTPVVHETENDLDEFWSDDPWNEPLADLSQEATERLSLGSPTPMSLPETSPAPLPALEHVTPLVEPTHSQSTDRVLPSSSNTTRKPQSPASPQPKQKASPLVTAFTIQALAVAPLRQSAPRHRLLSDKEQELFQAVLNRDKPAAAQLLAAGISPNIKSRGGWTPLMWAVIDGDMTLVQALLDKGASINIENNRGVTPLMYAAWNGHADILQLFLDKGADAHTRDRNGATALHYVRDPIARFTRTTERPRIEQLLMDALTKTKPHRLEKRG